MPPAPWSPSPRMRSPSLTTMQRTSSKRESAENLIDPVAVGIADEQPARPAPDFREALASFAHGRGVDNRQQFLGVVLDHRVEQRLVVVLKIAHVAVLAECSRTASRARACGEPADLQACRCAVGAARASQKVSRSSSREMQCPCSSENWRADRRRGGGCELADVFSRIRVSRKDFTLGVSAPVRDLFPHHRGTSTCVQSEVI